MPTSRCCRPRRTASRRDGRNDDVCVVGELDELVSGGHRLQVASISHVRRGPDSRPLDDACCDVLQRRRLTTVHSAVRMTAEEVDQPVVGIGWHVKLSQLLQQRGMSNRVKRLAEVQGDDCNEWVGGEQVCDGVEEGDDCSCWGASWTEGKLISE